MLVATTLLVSSVASRDSIALVKHLCFNQHPFMAPDVSSPFKTLSQFTVVPLSLGVSTHPQTTRPAAPPGCWMRLSTLPFQPPLTPLLASSPVLLPHGEISHSTRPGRGGGVFRLIRPSLLKELLLHRRSICLQRLALLLINAGHLLFSPTLPSFHPRSLVTPLSHLALSRGSSLNYLNYILILLLGSPNVSHPAISGTFSLYRTMEIHSFPLLILAAGAAAHALLLCTQTLENTLEWKLSKRTLKAAQHA